MRLYQERNVSCRLCKMLPTKAHLRGWSSLHSKNTRAAVRSTSMQLSNVLCQLPWQSLAASTQQIMPRPFQCFSKPSETRFVCRSSRHWKLAPPQGMCNIEAMLSYVEIQCLLPRQASACSIKCASIVVYLQECYAALLGSRDLPAGGCTANALQSILRQFSGLDTDADDMLVRFNRS